MPDARPRVTFLYPDDLAGVSGDDLARHWRAFCSGLRVWIGQTYVRLREAGLPVAVSPFPPRDGILVFHPDFAPEPAAWARGRSSLTTVAVRADREPRYEADFEIVQNGYHADDRRVFHVPHWPQPGLVPRDPSRGNRVRTVAYKGHEAELHPWLRERRWTDFLEGEGLEWVVDAVPYRGVGGDYSGCSWPDFSAVDLLVAVRPRLEHVRLDLLKPATKLQNAWAAGVPLLAGAEYPYQEIRRSSLDYIEVEDLDALIAAVRRLASDPRTYEAMVDNGRERARELTVPRIVDRWARLLFDCIPRRAAGLRSRVRHRLPRSVLSTVGRVRDRLRTRYPVRRR